MTNNVKECKSCKNVRTGPRTRKLIKLPTTTRNGKEVWACEYCDGPVVELAVLKAKRTKRA